MLRYIRGKVFHGYLEKEPKYSLPSAKKYAPGELPHLKPCLTAVNIHHHGDETAVVLEGKNLWFCLKTTVSDHHQQLSAQETTASSIQFNIPYNAAVITVRDGKVKISLQSNFAKPFKGFVAASLEVIVFLPEEYRTRNILINCSYF